jgi:predicted metal-dependent phosphoesterase TrpH
MARDGLIDLHAHTSHSDGSESPSEVVRLAASRGALALAITDHDTVDGLGEARRAAERCGIELISGIEISADHSPGTMHILGYFIDDSSPALRSELERLRQSRERRNPEIAERLRELGFDISYEEVVEVAGNHVVGRPHFARLLVEKGYATSIKEAFERFLKKGAAAYVEKERPLPAQAIELIRGAGGVAVLAHPHQLGLSFQEAERLMAELARAGLDGVEAIYSRHSPRERTAYAEMALRLGLAVTGGSDYHGSYKPDIDIVSGLGDLMVPYELLDRLKQRAARG